MDDSFGRRGVGRLFPCWTAISSVSAEGHHKCASSWVSRPKVLAQMLTVLVRSNERVFRFDATFVNGTSLDADRAWLDLFPLQGGFFKHPQFAPNRSTFSVFHQLHCLDGLRRHFRSLVDLANNGGAQDTHFAHKMPHVEHCIELLRNALMCRPDLTIEVSDPTLGGVAGFGTTHICLEWEQLVDWTTEWEAFQEEDDQLVWNAVHDSHHSEID
jgi:hypothetical protein